MERNAWDQRQGHAVIDGLSSLAPTFSFSAARHIIVPRQARQNRSDRIAYSVTWAVLRMAKTIRPSVASDRSGFSQRSTGAMNLEVFPEDIASLEAEKMISIQRRTGSQYLRTED